VKKLSTDETAEIRESIRKIALLNAVHHDRKAQNGPVFGKLLAEHPELKAKIKEISQLVTEVVQEVNKLVLDEQKRIVGEKWPEALVIEKVEVERKLPPLPNITKYRKIVTRFSPNPDCAIHLGSARAIILSHEYAKMHNGTFYLRFEDTDPKVKKPRLPFYDSIREDLAWLRCKPDGEFIQSDRLLIYYEHAERLLKNEHAYVCTCQPEAFRKKILAKKPCPCRQLSRKENLTRWKHMLNGEYEEGEAVVRVKTDLDHPNPAVRDWPALRIIDTEKNPHPRVGNKFRVWPLYNFACGIDDHLMGVTHIIRGKEHLTNQVRQEYLYKYFGWEYPETIHYGRLKITGAFLSKSKIVEGINTGFFKSWDDPRLATFAALRRRGIMAEAIRLLMIDVGPKTADVTLSWENLYAHNRKLIDPKANRYFFVHNPMEMIVKNIPHTFKAKLHLHPDHPERGFRHFEIEPEKGEAFFWVSSQDMNLMETGRKIRLMGLFNIEIEKPGKRRVEATFQSESHEEAKRLGVPLIHWLPMDTGVLCEVVMPDASIAKGIAEESCKKLRSDMIVQFERFGFVRIDNLDEKLTCYFAHR
jgi:glutamyl-tRNA synthetase